MELWNVKDLEPPPVSTCKVFAKEVDIRLLGIALKEALDYFDNQKHLATEAALLSRCIYRFKMKFRSSKDLKGTEKLFRVLRTFLRMDFRRVIETLFKTTPQNYKMSQIYLLTKNMMDYVLVRLQGLGKILCRTLEICQTVSTLTHQRLRLGHFWKIALVIMAITARIFVISRNMLKFSCDLYAKLLPFSSTLRNSGIQWLPEDYVFPKCLDEWLGIDWMVLENNVIEIPDDDLSQSFWKLVDSDDDDVQFCDEYILVKDDTVMEISESDNDVEEIVEESKKVESNCVENNLVMDDADLDIGEEITNNDSVIFVKTIPSERRRDALPKGNKKKRKRNPRRYFK